MAHWAVVFPAERLDEERLFANDAIKLPAPPAEPGPPAAASPDTAVGPGAAASPGTAVGPGATGPEPGDVVLLVADTTEPVLFGLGRMKSADSVRYTHRLLDGPLPAGDLKLAGPGVYPLEPSVFEASAGVIDPNLRTDGSKRTWLVSVDMPIEAASASEAARLFWSYVYELGPQELPAFVSPAGNELAMQAFVLGVETNQDPEEDD